MYKGDCEITFNPYKYDIFAFGLCFLEIVGGFDVAKLYYEGQFNADLLSEFVDEFTKNFPENNS